MKPINLPLSDLAVLLIDMQPRFLNSLRPGARDIIIPNQLEVISICAKHDIPLVVVEYDAAGRTIPCLRRSALAVPRQVFLVKGYHSAFIRTLLDIILSDWKVNALFHMGITADFCVKETAMLARSRCGYQVMCAQGLVAGAEEDSEDDSAAWWRQNGLWWQSHQQMFKNLKVSS